MREYGRGVGAHIRNCGCVFGRVGNRLSWKSNEMSKRLWLAHSVAWLSFALGVGSVLSVGYQ